MQRSIGAARLGTLVALSALTIAGGCSEGALTESPGTALLGAARFTGEIVTGLGEAPAEDALGGIWISTVPGSTAHEDQVGIVIRSSTEIAVRLDDGSHRAGTTADLAVGSVIRVWTTDVEYLSIPPQYDATRVEIDPTSG